ncbi:hypothetical protein Tdes44962_MAKER06528 [Teratosphaeria destructans]|uniref:Uncharacterized protein n=1 Tax=Teratosphaeria destructans TaxID=418781 RepID=A0A9W7T1M4_9PEZI|nr:hypothetical protein Tdes44962_MAKER06528 [Teratosphaeria destructans]
MSAQSNCQARIAKLEAEISDRERRQARSEFTLNLLRDGLAAFVNAPRPFRASEDEEESQAGERSDRDAALPSIDKSLFRLDPAGRDEHYSQLYEMVQRFHRCLDTQDAAELRRLATVIGSMIMEFKDKRLELAVSTMSLMEDTEVSFEEVIGSSQRQRE